jgi:tRNA A-37 threonylcarbamoyl transferase component Bud32
MRSGSRLGKHRIQRLVTVGGMAEIYVARTAGIEGFEKEVILKRILPHLAADPEFVQMFLDEARLAATLHHPNIVQVFDIGHDEQHGYFFSMERVHGHDLSRVLAAAAERKRGLSLEHALSIVAGLAAGLHHAHEQGIVHRDVSPSNVLVTFDGCVKLVDFGVAKAMANRSKTRDGAIKGKVSYMSPEQCRGDAVDRRSDVFALGILLFELTTGKRLFKGDSDFAVLHRVVNEDAPLPSSRREGYDAGLEAIVMKALRRDPAERYATAEELQHAIEEHGREQKLALSALTLARYMREVFGKEADAVSEVALAPTAPGGVPAGRPPVRRRVWPAAAAGAVVLVAAGLLVARALQSSPAGADVADRPEGANVSFDAAGSFDADVVMGAVPVRAMVDAGPTVEVLPTSAPNPPRSGRITRPLRPAAMVQPATHAPPSKPDAGTRPMDPDAPWEQ